MADGLLSSGLNWIDQQKQALKARFGLLASNPDEFARQLAAETRARTGAGLIGEPKTAQEMASGKWINTPYGKQAIQAFSIAAPIAYHGSPYIFDKFDISKLGTGEGAQAYGHGMYFAESPDVARGYQMALSQKANQYTTIGGKPVEQVYEQIYNKANRLPTAQAQLEYDKAAMLEKMMLDTPPQQLIQYAKDIGSDPRVIQWLEKDIAPKTKVPGAFYKVDIPDEAANTFLNWDKPVSQQSKNVRDLLQKINISTDIKKLNEFDDALLAALQSNKDIPLPKQPLDLTGEKVYNKLINKLGSPKLASEYLYKNGIQGIKYLDQGSRSAGQGTNNFVVFDPNIVKMLERNEQPVKGLLK